MTKDKRRAKRISVELPVTVYLFNNKGKTRLGSPITGHIKDFSPIGVALTVAAIYIDGQHLFNGCHDNPDIVLELEFELGDRVKKTITVQGFPVWYDRDLDSDKKLFTVGIEFLTSAKSQAIEILSRMVCKDQNMLAALWKKLF